MPALFHKYSRKKTAVIILSWGQKYILCIFLIIKKFYKNKFVHPVNFLVHSPLKAVVKSSFLTLYAIIASFSKPSLLTWNYVLSAVFVSWIWFKKKCLCNMQCCCMRQMAVYLSSELMWMLLFFHDSSGVGSAVTGASVQHIGASLCLNSDPPPFQSLPLAANLPLR